MDVVGTAAAIIQLAGVGLALAQALYTLCDGTIDNKQVKELSFYIRSTSSVFEEVGKIFEEESVAPRRVISENAITTAKEVTEMCAGVFDTLWKIVNDAKKNSFGTLLLVLKSSYLRGLQVKLEQNKGQIQLLLQVIIYARLKTGISQSSAPNEADCRQALHNLISRGTLEQSRFGPLSDRRNGRLSDDGPGDRIEMFQLPRRRSIADLAASESPATITTLQVAAGPSSSIANARVDNSGQPQNKPPGLAPSDELHTHEDPGISYWLALYTVFCPCVARKKTRKFDYGESLSQTQGEGPQTTGTQLPSFSSPSELSRPAGMSSPPLLPSSPALSSSSVLEPQIQGGGPQTTGTQTSSIHSPVRLRPMAQQVPLIPDPALEDPQVVRLLQRWTTIYDGVLEGEKACDEEASAI